MALATGYAISGKLVAIHCFELFIAFSMCVLGIMKLRDLDAFVIEFQTYDLLAKRLPFYGFLYPFIETAAGLLMIAGIYIYVAAPAMLFIGLIGGYSVYLSVYKQKKTLKCACVGGKSNVPLGHVSFIENIMMVLMGCYMLVKINL